MDESKYDIFRRFGCGKNVHRDEAEDESPSRTVNLPIDMDKLKQLISSISFNEPYNDQGHRAIYSSVHLPLPLGFPINPHARRPRRKALLI